MYDRETRILIVEDTEITRTILKRMLEKLGYTKVSEATDGLIAFGLAEQALKAGAGFQIIIADWNMPNMNGLELLRKLQRVTGLRTTPFIMLTSNIERDKVVEAIKSGVTSYLAKPFTAASLEKKLKETWELSTKKKAA